jgi:chromosome segregation ATPase
MKKTLSIILLSTLCLAGSACKKSETEKAADKVSDKTDEVGDKAKNVADQERDVAKEAQDVGEAKGDLAQADQDLAKARDQYVIAMTDRLAKLDARLAELHTKSDVPATTINDLQMRRDALATKITEAKSQASTAWSDYKANVEKNFDDLEKAVDDAS